MTGPLVVLLAAFCAVIVFFPTEGSVGVPLHESITMLLGPTAFALPLGLGFVGVLMTVRQLRPGAVLPTRRLLGVGVVAVGVVAAEHLLGGVSLLGAWLTSPFVQTLGAPVTVIVVVVVIAIGAWLAFDARMPKWRKRPDAAAG